MSIVKLAPGQEAQYYALLAWNGMDKNGAWNEVTEKSFKELDATTYASGSVESAKRGIEKHLLKNSELEGAYITGEKSAPEGYFEEQGKKVEANFKSEEELCDAVVKILEEIHDQWVIDNGKKYDRDKEKNDKRLYQHLPTALIGLDEVAKDLMFLAPILEEMGYKVGKMQEQEWGAFVPSKAMAAAYQRYVEGYKKANGIVTEEDLKSHIEKITSTYGALSADKAPAGKEEFAQQRIAYMQKASRVGVLTESVQNKNPEEFGKASALGE